MCATCSNANFTFAVANDKRDAKREAPTTSDNARHAANVDHLLIKL
jgi:hypothetical protein